MEKFAREKSSLGIYLSGHPLMEQEQVLRRYATHTLAELVQLSESAEVTVGGIVTTWHQKKSKSKGEMYGLFTLEDLEARAEVLLFSETYKEFQSRVAKDAALLVSGRATNEEKKVKIIASAVVPLSRADEELEPRATGVLVRVPADLCDEDWLLDLETLLKRHRGPLPVYVDVVHEGASVTRLLLGAAHKVQAGKALVADVEKAVGRGRLQFLFRTAGGNGREKKP
jgi:DNA polymerase-3 subunit alpha